MIRQISLLFSTFLISIALPSQNETKKWFFGDCLGLDFVTIIPTAISTSSMKSVGGCSSIADINGNLLFYTNGKTIYNKFHQVMSNGNSLAGDSTATQAALIVKQPGNQNKYFVFTAGNAFNNTQGLYYSIIDMALSAGSGSVISKNNFLFSSITQKLCGTRHCNNSDVWILTHEWNNNNFQSYLLSAAGLGVPIISSVGAIHSGNLGGNAGEMKVSPNGQRIGITTRDVGKIELYDFDNATGVVSNPFTLEGNLQWPNFSLSCDFSPDGTKFYATSGVQNTSGALIQWDLCAGSPNSILNSKTTLTTGTNVFGLQVASDGKIYLSHQSYSLGVIHKPNLAGTNCNFIPFDLKISTNSKTSETFFPNFISSNFRSQASFTYSTSCQTAYFTSSVTSSSSTTSCNGAISTPTAVSWNFGDPASGSNNVSSLANPVHNYSGAGTFTAQMIAYHKCYTDTIRQQVVVPMAAPFFTITGSTTICKNETHTLVVSNPSYSYSWSVAQNPTVTPTYAGNSTSLVISPTVTTYYRIIATDTASGCQMQRTMVVFIQPCVDIAESGVQERIVRIYPNPATSELNYFTENEGVTLRIFSETGQLLFKTVLQKNKNRIDVSDIAPGVYSLVTEHGGKKQVQKMVKVE